MWLNGDDRYGVVHVFIHWLMAVALIGMFFLGWWMTHLDYYHAWYKKAPDLHRSVGVLLFLLLLARLGWRVWNPPPPAMPNHSEPERIAARVVHWSLYVLVAATAAAGYLMSTADGRSMRVFTWFEVPATLTSIERQEDVAGTIHWYLAVTLIGVATLHALAALKHHFVDKDATLRRMFGKH